MRLHASNSLISSMFAIVFLMKFCLSHQPGCSRQQCNAAHGRVTRELGSRGVGEGARRRIAHTPGVQFLEWRALGTHRHMLLQACWCTTHCATLINSSQSRPRPWPRLASPSSQLPPPPDHPISTAASGAAGSGTSGWVQHTCPLQHLKVGGWPTSTG